MKALNCGLSIQLNASCGGPSVGMEPPLGRMGRTALSPDSMLATASATPSTPATVLTVSGGSGAGSPNSAVLRTSRSTPAVTSSETFVKVLRSPSPSTNAETTKLTASVTPNAVRAKRTLFARRCLMVSRNMAVCPIGSVVLVQLCWFSCGGSVADPTHVVDHGIGCGVEELVGDAAIGEEDDAVRVAGGHGIVGDHHDRLTELADGVAHERQDLGAGRAVEVAGRLVGEDDLRTAGEGAGDGDALLLPAGELVGSVA